MVEDAIKWNLGISKLSGFMKFIRPPFKDDAVAEFHKIVDILEQSCDADLSHFRIPPDKMKRELLAVRPGAFRGGPGQSFYSDEKECDGGFFRSQLDGLASYLGTIRGSKAETKINPYDVLTDLQLEEMMVNRNIKPKRIIDARGEHFAYDRAHAIAELLKQDQPQTTTSISNVFNIQDSNFVHSSPGSSIAQSAGIRVEELQGILVALKQFAASAETSKEDHSRLIPMSAR